MLEIPSLKQHTSSAELPANPWRESLWLASESGLGKWTIPLMIVLGSAAALADAVGVGLAVLFLFVILDKREDILSADGFLSGVVVRVEAFFGTEPAIIAGVIFIIILLKALLVYANDIATATALNAIAAWVRDRLHRHYLTIGYIFLQTRDHGELLNTLSTESWSVSEAFFGLARIGVNICAVMVFGVILFSLSWLIALTVVICALAVFVMLRLLARPVRRLGEETLAANQILAERMLVSLNGMRTLRAFGMEGRMLKRFEEISGRVRLLAVRMERYKALLGPIAELGGLASLLVIALVANLASVDAPTVIAAVLLVFRLQPYLYEIETNRLALAGMGASLKKIREMLETDDKPWPVDGKSAFTGFRHEIRFTDVGFSHDPKRGSSISGVSFTIPAGQTTMIAGPSGSGKTTILNLLLRLYEPGTGRITVDGEDLGSLTRKSWLGHLAIAGQDAALLENTIAENLLLDRHDVCREELREVCAMVEILDDIEAMPDGFETRIGAHGLNLSGGQRQRLGVARALLCRPQILILDEAMSALEPEREDRIRKRITAHLEGVTIIYVSHRGDADRDADHIVFVENGRVHATGSRVAT